MTYPADPGGNFASDAHRRIMAHLPNPDDPPITVEALILERVNHDPHTLAFFESAEDVFGVLEDLEASGCAKRRKDGWINTKTGFDLLTGEPSEKAKLTAPATIGLNPASANGDS